MGGQGNVGRGSNALVSAMLHGGLAEQNEKAIRGLVLGGRGTINQKLMAHAAGLWSSVPEIVAASVAGLRDILGDELRFGPTWKEPLCPDSHGGMYWLGWIGVIAAGLRPGASPEVQELGRWAAVIAGQMLRLGDLVASPDGDCKGLPGNRAPAGAALGRRAHTNVYREVRGLPQRGPGGNKLVLRWKEESSDPLVDGAAFWVKNLLATPAGADLLRGPWSPRAPLPPRLRLPLWVARWNGGTLAWFEDPGDEEQRAALLTHGSASAKREGQPEPVVDWIEVTWTKPGKHETRAGLNWTTPLPEREHPKGATLTRIPGLKVVT